MDNQSRDLFLKQLNNLTKDDLVVMLHDSQNRLLKYKEENDHKIDFYEAVASSDDLTEMSMVAKVLNVSGYGRNKIFELLREKKILRYNNEPYQLYVDRGYFKPVEQHVTLPYGNTIINQKTMVTQRGIDFIRKVINEQPCEQ